MAIHANGFWRSRSRGLFPVFWLKESPEHPVKRMDFGHRLLISHNLAPFIRPLENATGEFFTCSLPNLQVAGAKSEEHPEIVSQQQRALGRPPTEAGLLLSG